ncbi:uncharacterized protein [Littorina saxatilis]|uniref:EF-hand domain-containing protein n=1 Tax=Littorina saxatilis TaxID=31220 RepID=A0AAN9AMP6_9CAEN
MSELSPELRAVVTAMFLQMDKDCNGWLSREELKDGFTQLGFCLSDFEAEGAFRNLDKNMDGRVTLDEYFIVLNSAIQTNPEEAQRAKLRRAFSTFDTNKDGLLTEDELLNGLHRAGLENISRQQLAKHIANMDRDGDGKINFEEFVRMFKA